MSPEPTARLFVALELPPEVRFELLAWGRLAAGTITSERPSPPGSLRLLEGSLLHLTICFLGARPTIEIPALLEAVAGCAEHACELELGGPLWLPPRQPRALAVAVGDPQGELTRLHEELVGALERASGWESEHRRLRPHVTVARLSGAGGSRRARRERAPVGEALAPTPQVSFQPGALSLVRSWLSPAGASYEALGSFQLTPPTG